MFKISQDIEKGINLFEYNAESNRLEFKYTLEIKEQLEKIYLKHFPNLNLNASTPQGQHITTLTQSFYACIDYLESCGTSFFLGGEGIFLDYWAWNLFRLKRKKGAPSSVLIRISGVKGTLIPATFTITDGTQNYIIEGATELKNNSVEVSFNATEINTHVALANTITQIVTYVDGVERVENINPATPATLRETDTEFFLRAKNFGSVAYNGSFRSILANINAVQGVKRVGGYENNTDKAITIKGTEVPPHCFAVIAEGGENISIAQAIYISKGAGSGMVGDVVMPIYSDRQRYDYKFFRPIYIEFEINIIITQEHNPPKDFATKIKDNINEYFNNVPFGYLITQPNIINACYNKFLNKSFIKDLKFCKIGEELNYNNIQMKFLEAPLIKSNNIIIELQD